MGRTTKERRSVVDGQVVEMVSLVAFPMSDRASAQMPGRALGATALVSPALERFAG